MFTPQIGHWGEVDKRWERTKKRKLKEEESMEMKKKKSSEAAQQSVSTSSIDNEEDEDQDIESEHDVDEFLPDSDLPTGKTKYTFEHVLDSEGDDMPFTYRHIRDGQRSVKSENYVSLHKRIMSRGSGSG